MPYDVELADRVRDVLETVDGLARDAVTEKHMFGGLAFLVHDHMAVAVSHQGGLMLRVDPAEEEALRAEPGVGDVVMRQRPMRGWLRVEPVGCEDDAALRRWIERGVYRAGDLSRESSTG